MTTLNFEQILTNWLEQKYQHRAFCQAIHRAYITFARQYPEWAASHFDEYFLAQHLNPFEPDTALPTPGELAHAWTKQMTWFKEATRRRLIAELTPIASDYLQWLKRELCGQKTVGKLMAQAT